MHGNEVLGRELLLHLASVLLYNYGKNKYFTKMVDTTRIHIMPTMNPDGYEKGQEGDETGVRVRYTTICYNIIYCLLCCHSKLLFRVERMPMELI